MQRKKPVTAAQKEIRKKNDKDRFGACRFSLTKCCSDLFRVVKSHRSVKIIPSFGLFFTPFVFIVSLEFGLCEAGWRAAQCSSLRTDTSLSSQMASGSKRRHKGNMKEFLSDSHLHFTNNPVDSFTPLKWNISNCDHFPPGRSTSGFHPRSSFLQRYQTLHSSLELRTESPAAAWQRTRSHLLPPGGARHNVTNSAVPLCYVRLL